MILEKICFWKIFKKTVPTFATFLVFTFTFLFGSVNLNIFIVLILPCFPTNFLDFIITHINAWNSSIKIFNVFYSLLKQNSYITVVFLLFSVNQNLILINKKYLNLYVFLLYKQGSCFVIGIYYIIKNYSTFFVFFNV